MRNIILEGDAKEKLKEIPDKHVDMVMTSPPYWSLRNYQVEGQIGLEPDFNMYIKCLCDIFDEVKRVLKDTGTVWVNIGDTYFGGCGGPQSWEREKRDIEWNIKSERNPHRRDKGFLKKSLCMIPFRFAIEMVNRGWILRNTIIWHKSNVKPESVKDRFTVDFEYLFFFSKKQKYYFEQQIEETQAEVIEPRMKKEIRQVASDSSKYKGFQKRTMSRNMRSVWNINTKPFTEAHFAVYPEKLCETPIKAGCPKDVCKRCGNPKILDIKYEKKGRTKSKYDDVLGSYGQSNLYWDGTPVKEIRRDYKPTCNCNSSFRGGIVLDPFIGSGTTGIVAKELRRHYIGIELNPEYVKIAQERLDNLMIQTDIGEFV